MRRRDWLLEVVGFLATGAASPGRAAAADTSLGTEVVRLRLRHTWTTTMSSSEHRDTLFVRLRRDGTTGIGEGGPIVRYQESAQGGQKALESLRDYLEGADPWARTRLLDELGRRLPGQYAAKAAVDIALHDWAGQKLGTPLYRLLVSTAPMRPSRPSPSASIRRRSRARRCGRPRPSPS